MGCSAKAINELAPELAPNSKVRADTRRTIVSWWRLKRQENQSRWYGLGLTEMALHRIAKPLYGLKPYQGFESLPLRQNTVASVSPAVALPLIFQHLRPIPRRWVSPTVAP